MNTKQVSIVDLAGRTVAITELPAGSNKGTISNKLGSGTYFLCLDNLVRKFSVQ
ncbi:MAG: hypothetical protein RL660_2270 [Bacteroidota bacterium]|jgi:hypothetical protein